jgi:hypothetical protein
VMRSVLVAIGLSPCQACYQLVSALRAARPSRPTCTHLRLPTLDHSLARKIFSFTMTPLESAHGRCRSHTRKELLVLYDSPPPHPFP